MKKTVIFFACLLIISFGYILPGCTEDGGNSQRSESNTETEKAQKGRLQAIILWPTNGFREGQKACVDGTSYTVKVSNVSGSVNGTGVKSFTFDNLTPGTYTVSVTITSCALNSEQCLACIEKNFIHLNKSVNKTVTVKAGDRADVIFDVTEF